MKAANVLETIGNTPHMASKLARLFHLRHRVIPLARFLRPASQYALPLDRPERASEGEPDAH